MATAETAGAAPAQTPTENLRLGDVDALVREHPGFTTPAVRTLIHRAKDNGLDRHIYRVGRKVLVDLNGFQDWVREQNRG
jgi:hypothetical protein